jgi:hypothetical protein
MPTMRMHRSKLRNHVAWNNIWIYYAVVTILHSQALSNTISLNLSSYQTANMNSMWLSISGIQYLGWNPI